MTHITSLSHTHFIHFVKRFLASTTHVPDSIYEISFVYVIKRKAQTLFKHGRQKKTLSTSRGKSIFQNANFQVSQRCCLGFSFYCIRGSVIGWSHPDVSRQISGLIFKGRNFIKWHDLIKTWIRRDNVTADGMFVNVNQPIREQWAHTPNFRSQTKVIFNFQNVVFLLQNQTLGQ